MPRPSHGTLLDEFMHVLEEESMVAAAPRSGDRTIREFDPFGEGGKEGQG